MMEREFNRQAGFTEEDDRLLQWMMDEARTLTNAVFDLAEADLDAIHVLVE